MPDAADVYIGVDIGGTKVAAGLVNTQGEILHKTRTPMHARGTAEEALGCVRTAIDAIRSEHPDVKIRGIGLISPGPVDPQTGMVLNPSNLPCWHNYPLAGRDSEGLRVAHARPQRRQCSGISRSAVGSRRGLQMHVLCDARYGRGHRDHL